MTDDTRIQLLLEEILETGLSPEEVCAPFPTLLPFVKQQLTHVHTTQATLDTLFPAAGSFASAQRRAARDEFRAIRELPRIPGYVIESTLGSGGMGVVYKARQVKLNRLVAIKMMLLGRLAEPRELECIQRESQAVAALRHPNIVQVYDAGDIDGLPYFSMEYLEGGTLSKFLAGVPQPARDAASLLRTLALAVQAAHDGHIAHRDLKPANILLAADRTPKIADFSLARRFEALDAPTITNGRIGTPSYMAPEQIHGGPAAFCPSVDLYALGAILYETLTGRPPFRAETHEETYRQVLAHDPALPSKLNPRVPRDLETICLKCLQKNPKNRYATAAALAEDLECYLDGRAISARRTNPAHRAARWTRRNPAAAALALTASLLLVLAITVGIRELHAADLRRARALRWNDRLASVVALQSQGRFTEARGILDQAFDTDSPDLQRRVDRARADLDLALHLDSIRMNRGQFTQGGGIDYAQAGRQYQAAFRDASLGTVDQDPAVVAANFTASPIRKAIVAALDDWAACAEAPARAWILDVARRVDPDPWRDRVRSQEHWADLEWLNQLARDAYVERQPVHIMVAMGTRWRRLGGDPTAFLEQVQREYPNDFWVNFELGHLLGKVDVAAAIGYCRAALAARPDASPAHFNLGIFLARTGRKEEAASHLYKVLDAEPNHGWAHRNLGFLLADENRDADAIVHLRAAASLDPTDTSAREALRRVQIRSGQGESARAEWRDALDAAPFTHDDIDGYAELSLYLGDTTEYEWARTQLLTRFGSSADPRICERTGRACLLAPGTDDELSAAAAMIDRALAADPSLTEAWTRPYFLVAKALAECRAGRYQSALDIIHGDVETTLGPTPHLIRAIAQQRLGDTHAALTSQRVAETKFDWSPRAADVREAWIYHILRREAASLIAK